MLARATLGAATAPWWGVPIVAGAFTLVGVALSQLAGYFSDKRRVERDDLRRWDGELRQVVVRCSQILLAIEERTILSWGEDASIEVDDRIYHQRYTELLQALVELDLIAPVGVSEAAHAAAEAATSAERWSSSEQELFHRYVTARRNFVNAIRTHLGVEILPEPRYL